VAKGWWGGGGWAPLPSADSIYCLRRSHKPALHHNQFGQAWVLYRSRRNEALAGGLPATQIGIKRSDTNSGQYALNLQSLDAPDWQLVCKTRPALDLNEIESSALN
jgi:hypothetical protein